MPPYEYDFREDLQWSKGQNAERDMHAIRLLFGSSCSEVCTTSKEQDRQGYDYVVTLRRGATVLVDAKRRKQGSSRYWKHGEPDLQLEIWSVMPQPGRKGKAGWTLSESSEADLILFSYDPSDTHEIYLIPFQLLRMAFRRNLTVWQHQYKKTAPQNNGTWHSQCMFVPRSVVAQAINELQWNTKIPLVRGGQLDLPGFMTADDH